MEASSIENSPRELEPSLTELSESILCPILQTPMQDPVMASDGHSYERAAIEQWISQRGARAVSPLTGARLAHLELTPNITLKVIIQTYLASLPQRHLKQLNQQDLELAIKLREEELSNQLAKQHKQLEYLSSVQERLGPMAQEIERLKTENELLRRNTKIGWGNNNNNNNNSNNNSNNDNCPTVLSDSDPFIEKHLSDIHSLSEELVNIQNNQSTSGKNNNAPRLPLAPVKKASDDLAIKKYLSEISELSHQLSDLNQAHAANMLKRFLSGRINHMKLKKTKLIQEEENILHRIKILDQSYLKIHDELQQRLQASIQEIDLKLKYNLTKIGKKITEHSHAEGDDEILVKLATERQRLKELYTNTKAQLEAAHNVEQKREEQKQALAVQEQKNILQKIRASKESKRHELSRWADCTKRYTNIIEAEREKCADIFMKRSVCSAYLADYTQKPDAYAVSKLMMVHREREERKMRELAERQAKEKVERENAEKQARILAEREAAEREAARLASLTSGGRINIKAQSVIGRVRKEEITKLFHCTFRGQLDQVRACLSRNRDLVHAQGDLTDLSHRIFPQITGFQYAVWAGDEDMWNIFLEFMSQAEAYDQLMALLNERIDILRMNGMPISFFEPLLEAYSTYDKANSFYDRNGYIENKLQNIWCKSIIAAENNMPGWFACVFVNLSQTNKYSEKSILTVERDFSALKLWFRPEYCLERLGYKFYDRHVSNRGITCVITAVESPLLPPGEGEFSYSIVSYYKRRDLVIRLKKKCTEKLATLVERLSPATKNVTNLSLSVVKK